MMIAIFGVYFIVPICIIFTIRGTADKKIKKCRIRYATPAIILTVLNIVGAIYLWQAEKLDLLKEPSSFFIPGIILLFVIIIYNVGKKQERLLQTEIASVAIENARYAKSSSMTQSIIIDSRNEEEIEKL